MGILALMGGLRHMQTGFIAGETSPMMAGRVETDHHAYGLSTCENFVPFNEGPIVKRPGFEYICDADPTSTWLTLFRFNVTQEYVLEWGQQKLRLYTNGGRIENPVGTPVEVAMPYAASDAPLISAAQSFDRQYLAHGAYPPGALSRTGAINFSYAPLALTDGPYGDENANTALTVQVSATTGAGITLTASAALFTSGDVGTLMRIDAQDFSTVKPWEPGMSPVAAGEIVRSDSKTYTALTGGRTGTETPIHERGAEWDGQLLSDVNAKGPYGVQWQFRTLSYGTVQITAVTSPTTATATVLRQLPDSLTTVPSSFFRMAAFSSTKGYPGLTFLWLGRLGFIQNFQLMASVAGDFLNFQIETSAREITADMAFSRQLDIENIPLWCAVDRQLLIGTATRELAVGTLNAAAAISSDNISATPQSRYGSAAVRPVQAGTQTIFVERGGRRVRAADYDFMRDRYDAPDLTATARHITIGGVVQMTVQRTPQLALQLVRGDGQLIVHPLTQLQIKGFARVVLGGGARALSAVSIVAADGATDELWLLVERERIGSDGSPQTAREIWKQAKWRELGDDATLDFFVDCGVQTAAAAGQAHFSGFTFLAGQTITGLAGGGVIPDIVVGADGTFTLPPEAVPATGAYTLTVGLAYTATAITRTPPINVATGPLQGLKMRWRRVVLRVLESLGIKVGQDPDTLEELIERSVFDQMDTPIPLFTGDTPGTISSEIRRDGACMFVSDVPKPAIINAAMLTGEADDKDG
jgi:hypothetical protein